MDLYVANDSNPNYVYENDGGRFEEVGLWSGAALDVMGNAQAGMGANFTDADYETAKVLAEGFGVEAYSDYKEMLSSGITAVNVATPTETHHRIVLDALGSGLHVLVEHVLGELVVLQLAGEVRLVRRHVEVTVTA